MHRRAVATAGSRRSRADVDWLPACCSMMSSRCPMTARDAQELAQIRDGSSYSWH